MFLQAEKWKFNNTLPGFVLSSKNGMNVERDRDLSAKSAGLMLAPPALMLKPSPISTPFSRVRRLFLCLSLDCVVLRSLVYPKKL